MYLIPSGPFSPPLPPIHPPAHDPAPMALQRSPPPFSPFFHQLVLFRIGFCWAGLEQTLSVGFVVLLASNEFL